MSGFPLLMRRSINTAALILFVAVVIENGLFSGCGGEPTGEAASSDVSITNWMRHDRSHDRTAIEYGSDLLDSCARNAILFTRGDNDTYPLWYLQTVSGYRTDVCVINLSLLNTSWYIRQLRDRLPVLLSDLTDDFIDRRLTGDGLAVYATLTWPSAGDTVRAAGITWRMLPDWVSPDSSVALLSPSQWMLTHLINRNASRRPVYFTTTPLDDDTHGLRPYLSFEGLVYRLTRKRSDDGSYRTDTPRLTAITAQWSFRRSNHVQPRWLPPDIRRILGVYDRAYRELKNGLEEADIRLHPRK
jgi:hypothetical protein